MRRFQRKSNLVRTCVSIEDEVKRKMSTSLIFHMLQNPTNGDIQDFGCAELSKMAESEEGQTRISCEGGIEAIIDAMNNHVSNAAVQENACKALASLAYHHDENRTTIPSEHGIEAILRAMKIHASTATVQEEACQALYNLACHLENKQRIARQGGIDLIIQAMKNHKSQSQLLQKACRALRNLSYGSCENSTIISHKGGTKAIIDLMKKETQHVHTVTEACKALYNLSFTKQNKHIISREGGIKVIVRNIKWHSANPDFITEALRTLFFLAFEDDSKTIISQCGVPRVTSLLLKKHIEHVQVQKEGYKLLRKLSQNHTENKKVILQEEMHIISTIKEYRANPDLLKEILRMLYNLTHNYIHHEISFYGNDYIPPIIDIMRENASSVYIQIGSLRVINNLLVNNVRKYILLKQEGVPLIFQCMRRHNSDAQLYIECYDVLEKLSSYHDAMLMICSEDFVSLVKEGMKTHISNVKLQEKGSELFRLLSINGDNQLKCSPESEPEVTPRISNKVSIGTVISTTDIHTYHADIQGEARVTELKGDVHGVNTRAMLTLCVN